ncbi:NERD domain-containing protein [Ornithinibacillus bavariensis]|uniref:NERD domain-containing protein n=1 Tax=Ornithinibacillus bavariensis TaxID=545502 RepID=A0A919XD48_9BACI|nr:NERD domain-containing protein [Ornithinibacillus bavariensis]GIO28815.1 hypothetical protein J43TS3_34260 [Ornithinibacillus bavariensis]
MAQLIKMQNYVSRYEWDMYRYPSQFIRLKQDNWNKLHYLWRNQEPIATTREEEIPKQSKWKGLLRKKQQEDFLQTSDTTEVRLPSTEEELKLYFLDQLFQFQVKWATSTVSNVSFVDSKYHTDPTLKYFLQRFPDTYLVMYYPIFEIRNAPIESEIIIFISPIGIEIIYLLEEKPDTIIMASDDRSWVLEHGNRQTKRLSPLFALKRTEKLIQGILSKHGVTFPIQKVVLSRTNIINFLSEPYLTRIIGKHDYNAWFKEKRSLASPLKGNQIKAAEALLKHCQSIYVRRPEWVEEQTQGFVFENGEE